jgi:transposase
MYRKETAREFKRRRSVELMDKGESPSVIARILGVSTGSIYKWHKIYHNGGSLVFKAKGGRPRKLSNEQLETLRRLLLRGATAFGWHNDLWTSKRVAEIIRTQFKINISRYQTWVYLTRYLGWSSQKPTQRLRERNEFEILRWKLEDFPQIQEDVEKRGAYLIFVDESGFLLTPSVRRTFSPRGQVPVIKVSNPHGRISAIGALAISPKRKYPYFYCYLLADNLNFHSNSIVYFIKQLQKRMPGPMTIVWDAIPIHCSQPVKQYLEQHEELIIEQFPPYSPELNPVDKAWLYLKYNRLPNYAPLTVEELRTRLTDELNILKTKRHVLASCVRQSELDCMVTG